MKSLLIHCGSNCESINYRQLDLACAKRVFDSVARKMNPQKIMVCLTGGEPMMYKFFYEIAAYVKELGFSWGMTSNGTMITESVVDRLIECGIGTVTISLDGLKKVMTGFVKVQVHLRQQ